MSRIEFNITPPVFKAPERMEYKIVESKIEGRNFYQLCHERSLDNFMKSCIYESEVISEMSSHLDACMFLQKCWHEEKVRLDIKSYNDSAAGDCSGGC